MNNTHFQTVKGLQSRFSNKEILLKRELLLIKGGSEGDYEDDDNIKVLSAKKLDKIRCKIALTNGDGLW